jgi:hypothetical protein
MKMIWHQAVGQHPYRHDPVGRIEQPDKGFKISGFMEHLLPRISAAEHMVAIPTWRIPMGSSRFNRLSPLVRPVNNEA